VTGFAYLGALVASLGGLALIDHQHRLAFWSDWRRSAVCVGVGVVGLLAWDLAGLGLGIFARGTSAHMTGLLLAPGLPVEEALFLALLCYLALLARRWFDRSARARAAAGANRYR
jgi:lycopene cyclase domain-containing protein